MILVYCPACHSLVAGRGVDRETAEWAAKDHEDEHDEVTRDEIEWRHQHAAGTREI